MTTTNHFAVRSNKGSWRGERMQVKTFKYADDMHGFLNKSDNALHWREVRQELGEPTKRGWYVWAGQAWHNVKTLDPSALAHL